MLAIPQSINQLQTDIKRFGTYLKGTKVRDIPNTSGLYAFWWINETEADREMLRNFNRILHIKGKKSSGEGAELHNGHRKHTVNWNWNLEDDYVCLYVGKSSNISNRVKQHLGFSLGDNWYEEEKIAQPGRKKHYPGYLIKWNTACQFRAGIEHLLRTDENSISFRKVLESHIAFSNFSPNNGTDDENMIDRFYLEDLAIGMMRPWFNLDCER